MIQTCRGSSWKHHLVATTVSTSRARNIGNSTPRINNKSKPLRRSADPKPRRIVATPSNFPKHTHIINNNKKSENYFGKKKRGSEGVKETNPFRRRSSYSLMRALGWCSESDSLSWRRGLKWEKEESGTEWCRGRIMAGREPSWWGLGKSNTLLESPETGTHRARDRSREAMEISWVHSDAMSLTGPSGGTDRNETGSENWRTDGEKTSLTSLCCVVTETNNFHFCFIFLFI